MVARMKFFFRGVLESRGKVHMLDHRCRGNMDLMHAYGAGRDWARGNMRLRNAARQVFR